MLKKIIGVFLLLSFLAVPFSALAQETTDTESKFNPNFIISDYEMRDYKAMSYDEIKNFLESRGALNRQTLINKNGIVQYAAEIIYRAALDYQINPKVLLVTLQKEQSLVDEDNPTDDRLAWAMGYAVCDDCSKDDPGIQKFKGFGKQVDRAAWRLNYYFDNPDEFYFEVGQTFNIDGISVTPANQATVNLYNYTPHIHGNENFYKIWNRWFLRTYPDGSLLQAAGSKEIWLIQDGLKRKFVQMSALLSRYDINKVLLVNQTDLDQFEEGKPIKFTNYSLLSSPKGTVYLLVDDILRGFASAKVFKAMGYQWDEVEKVSQEDLADYTEGKPITTTSIYPGGALLQDKTTGGVYYVEEGIKKPIWSPELLKANFSGRKIVRVTPEELAKYPTGEAITFKDGELIKSPSDSAVYVVSHGLKLPILDEATFLGLGYKWTNIIVTSERAVELHATGEPLVWNK